MSLSRTSLSRAALVVLLGAGLAFAGSPSATATSPAQPEPNQVTDLETKGTGQRVHAAAGNRAYFVITAPADVAAGKTAVTSNGGTVFASYDPIGVIVAHSAAADFATKVRAVAGVQKVGATRTSDVPAAAANPAIPPSPSQSTPTANEVSRYDMVNIGADKAWDVNQGSAAVTVGVLDTGVDDQHYDLKANFDAGRSASCAYGRLDTREGSWRPVGDHGTHVAGTVAAAKNGKGMVGVAPGVKVSSVRIAEAPSGLFFPENTVCAFVFAGDKGIKVTNNSYYTDPWLFACPNDLDQAAIMEGVKRAAAYAEGKGVLNVAAAGNENYNLAGKSTDRTSPNDSTPVSRTVTNDCLSLPTELPGVVVVSALTPGNGKSSYSNFGTNKIHVAAPGDSVYSTVPGGGYGQKSGTSMASPHVAGVAALLASVNPSATVADLRGKLAVQADDLACSSDSRCTGSAAKNSFYGEGRVDALEAVNGTTPPGGKTFTNDTNVDVPDAGAAVTSSVEVTGITGNAPSTLKVAVDVKHPYRGDLVIDLVAPDGSTYRLKSAGNDSGDNVITTYTVNASSEVANGTWKLKVQDVYSADTGYIDSWSLIVKPGLNRPPSQYVCRPLRGTRGRTGT